MSGPFTFHLATRIVWQSPAAGAVPAEAAALDASRVLVVADPGVVAAGLVAPIAAALEGAGIIVTVTAEVAGNPTTADVAVVRAAAAEAQAIVAVGGGSVIDTAKAAAMLLANGGEYADYQWHGKPITARSLPLLAVPTTAGTGSEVTRVAVISDAANPFKKGVLNPLMFPHVAILDPSLTAGLPPGLTAATGMDAFSHALEAYVGNRASPPSDLLALEALRLAVAHLPRATENGADRDARRGMMLAALYGGIAMDQAGLGLIHALSGGLCSHLHFHHGYANALLLPHVLEYNAPAIPAARLAALAAALGLGGGADAATLVGFLDGFVRSLGMPVGLAGEDTAGADWDAIAADSMRMAMVPNNPRPPTAADLLAILDRMR